MDVNEIARGLAVESMEALGGLKVGAMLLVNRPHGYFARRDEILEALGAWLIELVADAKFEVKHAGRDDYQVKRIA